MQEYSSMSGKLPQNPVDLVSYENCLITDTERKRSIFHPPRWLVCSYLPTITQAYESMTQYREPYELMTGFCSNVATITCLRYSFTRY